jgi:8-oxo-dGTP pyrophosphatase MutT (NUDIX family)
VPEQFQSLGGKTVFEGHFFEVSVERFRYSDGEEVTRDIVRHPGAAAAVAHDDEHVWLVRQPRETVGEPDLLELPAGILDVEGETPLQTIQRELAEEIGKAADYWEPLVSYYSSAGFTNETVHVFLGTELRDVDPPDDAPDERIEIVPWPLADLEGAIAATRDAKTLIGLTALRDKLSG